MNIQTKKKIGEGLIGTVYLSNVNGKNCITKIEKYKEEKDPLMSSYYRQLDFNKVAMKYPDKFLTLVQHGIIMNCDHVQTLPTDPTFPKNLLKHLKEKNKLNDCYVLSYVPVLEGTLYDILSSMTKKQWLDCFIQLAESVNIIKSNGFYHRDLHSKNIMYKKKGNKYKWYIIDYGLIWKKTYPKNYDDKIMKIPDDVIEHTDIMNLLRALINDIPVFDYINKKQLSLPPYNNFIKYIKNDHRYEEIHQIIRTIGNTRGHMANYYIDLITILYFNDLWIDALGIDSKKHKELIVEQHCPNVIMYALKHLTDKNYNKLINYCKKI